MIAATTTVALLLLAIALLARRFRSDFEETAWRLMAIAMLVTPGAWLLPKVDIGMRIPFFTVEELVMSSGPPRQLYAASAPPALVMIYFVVSTFLLARLAVAAFAAMRLRRDSQPLHNARVSASLRVPVTAGVLRPTIILPDDARTWSDTKLAAVLAHETAHVHRRDPMWRFAGRLAAAICWFHPLAWMAAASIERLAEEAADREAIAATRDRHGYAEVLLEVLGSAGGSRRLVLASAMFDGRAVCRRIDTILEPRALLRRSPFLARFALSLFVGAAIFSTAMTKDAIPAPPMMEWTERDLHGKRDAMREAMRERLRAFFRGLTR